MRMCSFKSAEAQEPTIKHLRLLEGFELMQLIGWDVSEYARHEESYSSGLLTSLAGNACSAFALAPWTVVAVGALGFVGFSHHPATPQTQQSEVVASSDYSEDASRQSDRSERSS